MDYDMKNNFCLDALNENILWLLNVFILIYVCQRILWSFYYPLAYILTPIVVFVLLATGTVVCWSYSFVSSWLLSSSEENERVLSSYIALAS